MMALRYTVLLLLSCGLCFQQPSATKRRCQLVYWCWIMIKFVSKERTANYLWRCTSKPRATWFSRIGSTIRETRPLSDVVLLEIRQSAEELFRKASDELLAAHQYENLHSKLRIEIDRAVDFALKYELGPQALELLVQASDQYPDSMDIAERAVEVGLAVGDTQAVAELVTKN